MEPIGCFMSVKFILSLAALLVLSVSAHAQLPNAPTWMPGGGVQTCNETWPGTTIDSTKWKVFPGGSSAPLYNTGVVTAVLPQNLVAANPGLNIVTKKQNFQMTTSSWANYTGSYINGNQGPVDACGPQQFGWFQSTLTQPSQQGGALGSWTAFWLLPWDNRNEWEIDVMERFSGAFGPASGPTIINATLHSVSYSRQSLLCVATSADNWEGTHTFAVDWEPTYMEVYIDGVLCTAAAAGGHANNPTGHFVGAAAPDSAIPQTMGYTLWDNYITNAAVNQQADLQMPNTMHVISSQNWQKTGNAPSQPTAPVVFKQATITMDKAFYQPGDTVNFTFNVTAGAAGVSAATVAGFAFDYCGDNNGSNSYCMFPAVNNTFGKQIIGSPAQAIAPNATATFHVAWVASDTSTPAVPLHPGIYTIEVAAQDSTGGGDNLPMKAYIQIGNPMTGP